MRAGIVMTALVAAAVCAATAFAAPAGRDPVRLLLVKADFPAGTNLTAAQRSRAPGIAGSYGLPASKDANSAATIPAGGSIPTAIGDVPKTWRVEMSVWVAADVATARKLFGFGKPADGLNGLSPGGVSTVKLRSYGDEQLAWFAASRTAPAASVFVRKGPVLWQLQVTKTPNQWAGVTKAQLLAQLNRYAAKEQRKVG